MVKGHSKKLKTCEGYGKGSPRAKNPNCCLTFVFVFQVPVIQKFKGQVLCLTCLSYEVTKGHLVCDLIEAWLVMFGQYDGSVNTPDAS